MTIQVQFSRSVVSLCSPVNRSMPGLPVHRQLPEFTQTHVHRVGDAIQPSHPLSSPSPPAPNPSQHQGLFQWVNSSHEVANSRTVAIYSEKLHVSLSLWVWFLYSSLTLSKFKVIGISTFSVCVVLVTQLCPTLWDPTEVFCSPPGSSVHGIF